MTTKTSGDLLPGGDVGPQHDDQAGNPEPQAKPAPVSAPVSQPSVTSRKQIYFTIFKFTYLRIILF